MTEEEQQELRDTKALAAVAAVASVRAQGNSWWAFVIVIAAFGGGVGFATGWFWPLVAAAAVLLAVGGLGYGIYRFVLYCIEDERSGRAYYKSDAYHAKVERTTARLATKEAAKPKALRTAQTASSVAGLVILGGMGLLVIVAIVAAAL